MLVVGSQERVIQTTKGSLKIIITSDIVMALGRFMSKYRSWYVLYFIYKVNYSFKAKCQNLFGT